MLKFKKESGYLMIEVMTALVVFSVALIGLLALQLNSSASTQSSSYRSMATNYANDLFDKMRANKDGVLNNNYIGATATNNSCRSVNFNSTNTAASCTSAQMAADDMKEFNSQVAATLPQGAAVVCLDSAQAQGTPTTPNCDGLGNLYVVKIFWKDTRGKAIGTNSGYSQVIIGGQL
jgi:type IV pilus assembly protein PilV